MTRIIFLLQYKFPLRFIKAIEEVLEIYGLSKLIDEVHNDKTLSFKEAKRYFDTLNNEMEAEY